MNAMKGFSLSNTNMYGKDEEGDCKAKRERRGGERGGREGGREKDIVWLNWFNAELSPKRSWRGQNSKEMGSH